MRSGTAAATVAWGAGLWLVTAPARPLEQVTVTATRSSVALLDYAGSVTRLGVAAVGLTGATHASELLNRAPGTMIQRGNGQESFTALRSPVLTGAGACGAVLVLEDGIPIRPVGSCNVNEQFEVNLSPGAATAGPAGILALAEAPRDARADGHPDATEPDRSGLPASRCRCLDRTLPHQRQDDRSGTAGPGTGLGRPSAALPGNSRRRPPTALAMVTTDQRAQFCNDDAFIACMGMDVRVRESGPYRGRRQLTKKGEPELRRLLFNAAMQGRRNPHWQAYYLALRERGLSSTAAFIALGRKIARLCFILLSKETSFEPHLHSRACMAT